MEQGEFTVADSGKKTPGLLEKTVFIVPFFAYYLFMLHPAVSAGDSGELITAAHALGIPHPPGYPLWTLLGKIFTVIIPFGNIAYRVNLMSAVFGALTCAVFCAVVRKTVPDEPGMRGRKLFVPLFVSSAIFCFSPTLLSQSVITEVYALNAFFVVLIIYLLSADFNLYLAVFIYGLSLANHYIMFLFGPIFALYVIWKRPEVLNRRTILPLFVFFLPGLFLYLYLPVRSSANPPIDWGNPENLKNFIAHIARFQYRGLEIAAKAGIGTKLLFVKNLFRQAADNFGIFAVISVFGLANLIKKDVKFALLTVFIFLANTIGLIILLNFKFTPQDVDAFTPYYIPAWTMAAIWLGHEICELRKIKFSLPVIYIMFLLLFAKNFRNAGRYNFTAYDYPVNVLKTVEKNGILYLHEEVDEIIFTLSYVKNVLEKRRDVAVIDSYNNIFMSKGTGNPATATKIYYSAVNTAKIKRPLYLKGLLWVPKKEPAENIWNFYVNRGSSKKHDYREQEVAARYQYFYGKFLIDSGDKKSGISELKKSLKAGPELVWLHNNVGDILRQNKDYSDSEYSLKKAILLDSAYSPAYYNLGLLRLEKQDDDGAAGYFQKAYRYDNTDKDSLLQLSKIHQRKGYKKFVEGRMDEAVAEYRAAIGFTPSEADMYYNIGVIYSQYKNNAAAREYFQKYIQLKPGGQNAETVKIWLKNN